jgi:L-seryl-tRNA(Ser) seleniumtransferase
MIRTPAAEIAARAAAFVSKLQPALPKDAAIEIVAGHSVIGGGSTPDQSLPTHLIAIKSRRHSAAQLESALRHPSGEALRRQSSEAPRDAAAPSDAAAGSARPSQATAATPVIARIEAGRVVLDLRTVQPDEESALADAVIAALL